MNGALAALIVVFLIILYAGKYVRRPGVRSYLFIIVMTMLQVGVVLLFIFNAKPPAQ